MAHKNQKKLSITLPPEVVEDIDTIAEKKYSGNRSMAINLACQDFIEKNQNLIEDQNGDETE